VEPENIYVTVGAGRTTFGFLTSLFILPIINVPTLFSTVIRGVVDIQIPAAVSAGFSTIGSTDFGSTVSSGFATILGSGIMTYAFVTLGVVVLMDSSVFSALTLSMDSGLILAAGIGLLIYIFVIVEVVVLLDYL
jgi:hypothetical protein